MPCFLPLYRLLKADRLRFLLTGLHFALKLRYRRYHILWDMGLMIALGAMRLLWIGASHTCFCHCLAPFCRLRAAAIIPAQGRLFGASASSVGAQRFLFGVVLLVLIFFDHRVLLCDLLGLCFFIVLHRFFPSFG